MTIFQHHVQDLKYIFYINFIQGYPYLCLHWVWFQNLKWFFSRSITKMHLHMSAVINNANVKMYKSVEFALLIFFSGYKERIHSNYPFRDLSDLVRIFPKITINLWSNKQETRHHSKIRFMRMCGSIARVS